MSSSLSNILLLLILVDGHWCSLNDVRNNRYSIFPGMDVIKMDKCRSDTVATHKHCRLYGLFIEKLPENNNTTNIPRTPDDIDPGFYVRLYNKTNNYFPLMNYISIFNNPSVKRDDMLEISAVPLPHGPRNDTNYILDNNITRSLMRAVRFVQWTINLPIAAVFEELLNGISNIKNKDGFYILLIKFFKLTNSDMLFYCKFTSTDHCLRMYEGINFKIATNNILYGNCDPKMPITNIKKGKSFIYFCDSNDLNITIDAVNGFLNKSITNDTTYLKEIDALNTIELLNEKSTRAKSIFRISSYRLMGELLGRELRPTKLDLKPMWDKSLSYLVLLQKIINEYDLDLTDVVFNVIEREYSIEISDGGAITKNNHFYSRLENVIKIMCWHDISTCDLRDPGMNLQINVNFINYIPLRLEPNLFQQNMHILLTAHDVNTTNLIFSKIIYNDLPPLTEYTHEEPRETDESVDMPPDFIIAGHSWLYWTVIIGLTCIWTIVVFLIWAFFKCIFCPTKKVTYAQKNQELATVYRSSPGRDKRRPQKIIQYNSERIGVKDINIPLIKSTSQARSNGATRVANDKKRDVEYDTTRAEIHWSSEIRHNNEREQNNNNNNDYNTRPARTQLNRENSIYESADYVPIQCSFNRGILKTPSPVPQRQKQTPSSDILLRKQYNPTTNPNSKRSLSLSTSVLSLDTADKKQNTLPSINSRLQIKNEDIYGLQELIETLGPDIQKSHPHYQSPKPQPRPIFSSSNEISQSSTLSPIKREHADTCSRPSTFSPPNNKSLNFAPSISQRDLEAFDFAGARPRRAKISTTQSHMSIRNEIAPNKRDSIQVSNTYSSRDTLPAACTSDLNYMHSCSRI